MNHKRGMFLARHYKVGTTQITNREVDSGRAEERILRT
jgi:hypothetical protein